MKSESSQSESCKLNEMLAKSFLNHENEFVVFEECALRGTFFGVLEMGFANSWFP